MDVCLSVCSTCINFQARAPGATTDRNETRTCAFGMYVADVAVAVGLFSKNAVSFFEQILQFVGWLHR